MLAIYKKEMRTYFTSIVGYLFLGFFLALIGLYFYGQNLRGGYTNFGYALMSVSLFFILLVPMLTMRIMAEENRQKTDQLLYTSPVSVTKIIIGKYLSVLTMFSIVMLIVCFYPLILAEYGNVNLKMTYAVIFSFFLMGAAYMAIGLFISSSETACWGMKRQHQLRPCLQKFLKNQARASFVRAASVNSALWRDIQTVVLQQSKDQPDQFSGS